MEVALAAMPQGVDQWVLIFDARGTHFTCLFALFNKALQYLADGTCKGLTNLDARRACL